MGYIQILWTGITLAGLVVLSLRDIGGQNTKSYSIAVVDAPKELTGTDDAPMLPTITTAVTKPKKIHYSVNWAGAVNSSPPSGRFAAVKMNLTLPKTLGPDYFQPNNEYYAANAWLGIDGWSHRTALLQAGIVMEVNKSISEELVFRPWYEWWPKEAMFFDIPMGPGDDIQIEVVMFNATYGKIILENLSRGEWVARKLKSPYPDAGLVGSSVEWIMEDFALAVGGNVPFGNFGMIQLRDCTAYTSENDMVTPDPSQSFWIRQKNITRARSTVSGSLVTIEYNRPSI